MHALQGRAKEQGPWGLSTKARIARSGNLLVVRIPADLARYLKLKKGQGVMVSLDERVE